MLLNIPLMAVFFGLWVGIPLWMVVKHPDTGPEPAAAPTATAVRARHAGHAEAAYRRVRYPALVAAAGSDNRPVPEGVAPRAGCCSGPASTGTTGRCPATPPTTAGRATAPGRRAALTSSSSGTPMPPS